MHARPHLETHTRSKGHSAVAGIAYRMGIRLFDKRTGVWHDHRRRQLADDIASTFTLAPPGSPAWATDPQTVWSAVEAAERRRDSQVAHDFRIPLPLGASEDQAVALATSMAQFIVDKLETVVSVALHRDAAVDALGVPKAPDKVGLHAHLYLPTRRFRFDPETASGDGDTDTGSWGFREKLSILSQKASAAACIESFNARWAELANAHAMAVGLPADYSHLSYARMGLDRVPEVTLGVSAAAMERRGIRTEKARVLRERRGLDTVAPAVSGPPEPSTERVSIASRAWLSPADPITVVRGGTPPHLGDARVASPLAQRVLAAIEGRPGFAQLSGERRERLVIWLSRIEHALRSLGRLVTALERLRERRQREDGARAVAAIEVDSLRLVRAEARSAVHEWLDTHPWQMKVARALGGVERRPAELVRLQQEAERANGHVQAAKRTWALGVEQVKETDAELAAYEAHQVAAQVKLSETVAKLVQGDPLLAPVMLEVADTDQIALLMPVISAASMPKPMDAPELQPVALPDHRLEDVSKELRRPRM